MHVVAEKTRKTHTHARTHAHTRTRTHTHTHTPVTSQRVHARRVLLHRITFY